MKYLLPLTILFLIAGLVALAWHAGQRHGFGPFGLGLVGAIAVVAGKFWLESNLATYAGVGFMILASFWNARGIKHPGGEQASPSGS